MDHEQPVRQEPDVYIENEGEGKFTLMVDGSPVIKIGPTYANPSSREFHFAIYGPCNLDRGIAIMKGFLHLTALLGNEQRANNRAPADESSVESKGAKKWRNSRTIRKSKP